MKLMSYINTGIQWGIVIFDQVSQKEYVIDPQKIECFLDQYCSDRTVGYFLNRPHFFEDEVPKTMVDFLKTGEAGMTVARNMKDFVERFIVQSDRSILIRAANPIDEVEFLAPVPEPRLLWGLVGNVSSFSRSKWEMKQLQLVPQGHQRPLGTVIGHNQKSPMYSEAGGNAEFAFVIGKKGRKIEMKDAMEYVAGYTIVNDMCHALYAQIITDIKEKTEKNITSKEDMLKIARESGSFFANEDIYTILSSSWSGKSSDRMCAIGPWIVTPDEIGDPYDLLVNTKRNGEQLGRGHTCGLLVGIERAIAYYSSFATLYPGDIIHLGAVSKDGYSFKTLETCTESCIQSEIENIGTLNTHVSLIDKDEEKSLPEVDKSITELKNIKSMKFLNATKLNNLYNVYGNTVREWNERKLAPKPFPRFLCVPGNAVGTPEAKTDIFTNNIRASAEFCAVIGKTARGLKKQDVASHILGFCPMICIEDKSLMNQFKNATIAFEREWALPEMYGRWGDAYNIVSEEYIEPDNLLRDNSITLKSEGKLEKYNTKDYYLWFEDVISFISTHITLYPGDIITLGNLGPSIDLSDILMKNNRASINLKFDKIEITKTIFLKKRK